MTTVVNIYRDECDVYIGRTKNGKSGYFGNPFYMKFESDRISVVEKYKVYFYARLDGDKEFASKILELKDKKLGCYCKPKACHGDVIKEYLDGL